MMTPHITNKGSYKQISKTLNQIGKIGFQDNHSTPNVNQMKMNRIQTRKVEYLNAWHLMTFTEYLVLLYPRF